jgi:hypothetical protein
VQVDRRATTRRQPLVSQRIGSNYPRIDPALVSLTYLSSTSARTVFTMAESELTPKFAPFIGMVSGWLVAVGWRHQMASPPVGMGKPKPFLNCLLI